MTNPKMLLASIAVFMFGCASDHQPADGLDVDDGAPDRLSGTFTRDGITVAFDFSETGVHVKTIDNVPLVEATLDTGIHVADGLLKMPEGGVVTDLFEAIGDEVIIGCRPVPSWRRPIKASLRED